MTIEKKIEYLESLAGQVSNRKARRYLNDRLLMELIPRLNEDEIRSLFAPPPWGDDVPLSAFCRTNVEEWDEFRSVDMDKQDNLMSALKLNDSPEKKKGQVDSDKVAVLTAWRRVNCRTREALRRSSLFELIDGYEDCIRAFITSGGDEAISVRVKDPFHRLLLHGVCEFYDLVSVTAKQTETGDSVRATRITKKKKGCAKMPRTTMSHFLKMSKGGLW